MFPLPSLTAWHFLAAGAICALGPVVIHLLNRRRYKVVQWAAMDFLREAMQRNRRIMQLRDILLLVLRTAAVLLFGLALARPFFSQRRESSSDRLPVHAIVLLDNSLSMGYESLEGTLLTKAQDKARAYIDRLPAGSKISVIPVCGSREGYSPDPHDTKEAAIESLEKIETVDRSATFLQAMAEAEKARQAAEQLAKRIVFFTDQQQTNWRSLAAEQLKDLPPVQVVDVSSGTAKNAWVANLSVQDGLADIETPTTIVVEIAYSGLETPRDVPVKLYLEDAVIGDKLVTLPPGEGAVEVDFQHVFSALSEMPEPGKPVYVSLRAAIGRDELPADDERFLVTPVVAALPVVFVDQYGADEDPIRQRLGETLRLRRLLAPKAVREDSPRQVVQIRHLRLEELTQENLADARLVVLAGLSTIDEESVLLLREYVQQGGELLLAAGADFQPQSWNDAAWRDGAGILPAPLAGEPLGEIPEVAGERVRPFFLSYDSLAAEDYFHLAGLSEQELRDLYAEPFFFKAVDVRLDDQELAAWRSAEGKRLTAEWSLLQKVEQSRREIAATTKEGVLSASAQRELAELEEQLRQIRPQWLVWGRDRQQRAGDSPGLPAETGPRVERLLQEQAPRVLARFENSSRSPYLVERKIGDGKVVFAASGISSSWNTLLTTNATVLFDRLLRGMIEETLPQRNFAARERLTLPLLSDDPGAIVALLRPNAAAPEPLDIGYIGEEQRGITLTDLYQRGIYRVSGYRSQSVALDTSPESELDKPSWQMPLAIGGDAEESNLSPLPADRLEEISSTTNIRWVGPGEEISLAGATIRGQNLWWWLALLAVLACLLVEMAILAWPNLRRAGGTT